MYILGVHHALFFWETLNISPVHFSSYSLVNIFRIYVILTLSPTLKRKGFRIVLLLLSDETFLGQYIFHHRLVSLPLVTLFGGIPIVLWYVLLVPGRFAPNPVRPLSRFAPIPVRPVSFRPYSRSPRVVSPSFINRALKNEIWKIPLQIFVFWML